MTRVKICGITNAKDRDVAIAAGADALGFIVDVDVDSPREITPQRAASLIADVPPVVTTVLVTMPESVDAATTLLDRTGADTIQIHGLEPAAISSLTRPGLRPIAAIAAGAVADAEPYADVAGALLVDSADEDGGGGTGRVHDWSKTRRLRDSLAVPIILAGGLSPENVAAAVRQVQPFGVDVATGVEQRGGHKDHEAVRTFIDRAKTARTEASP